MKGALLMYLSPFIKEENLCWEPPSRFPLTSHWPKLGLMMDSSCKGGLEIKYLTFRLLCREVGKEQWARNACCVATSYLPALLPVSLCLCFLFFFFFFGHVAQHAGSWFPDQGSKLHPLLWECRVLTTGPPGKSCLCFHLASFNLFLHTLYSQ